MYYLYKALILLLLFKVMVFKNMQLAVPVIYSNKECSTVEQQGSVQLQNIHIKTNHRANK